MDLIKKIFTVSNQLDFEKVTLEVFHYQAEQNNFYNRYLQLLQIDHTLIDDICRIPFMPIDFFKNHQILCEAHNVDIVFSSSGTTGQITSKHYVKDIAIYKQSFIDGFFNVYGDISQYCFLALLPSYLERSGSSLVFMTNELIKLSHHPDSGFFFNEFDVLAQIILKNELQKQPTILMGVSFALLQFANQYPMKLKHTIVMETGGMKGKHKEITKEELHQFLQKQFQLTEIHSEYGMTELLSQAYSKRGGKYECPPQMKVFIRDVMDPFSYVENGKTGGINIIDLANIYSCSFIETCDLGKINLDGSFEILGRFDNSEMRGCNLLVAG